MNKTENTSSSNKNIVFANKFKMTSKYFSRTWTVVKKVNELPGKVNETIDKALKYSVNFFLDIVEGSIDFCYAVATIDPMSFFSDEEDIYGIEADSEESKSIHSSAQKKSNPLDQLKQRKHAKKKHLYTIKSVDSQRKGIENPGDSCFLNSVLQSIASSSSLLDHIKNHTLTKRRTEKRESFEQRKKIKDAVTQMLDTVGEKKIDKTEVRNLRKLIRSYYDINNIDNAKIEAVVNVEDAFMNKLKSEILKKKITDAKKKKASKEELASLTLDTINPSRREIREAKKNLDLPKLTKDEEQKILKRDANINDTGQHDASELFNAFMVIFDFSYSKRITEHNYTGGLEEDFTERNMPRQVFVMSKLDFATSSLPHLNKASMHVRTTQNSKPLSLGTLFKFTEETAESPCRQGANQKGLNYFDEQNCKKPSSQKTIPVDEETMHLFSTINNDTIDEKTIPKTLPILLKRYDNLSQKLTNPVECPDTVEINIMTGTPIENNRDDQDIIDPKPTGKKAIYKLKSVVVHVGGTKSGHYYSYVRHPAKIKTHHGVNTKKDIWVEYNDALVTAHNDEMTVTKDIEINGYLYFYDLEEIVDA